MASSTSTEWSLELGGWGSRHPQASSLERHEDRYRSLKAELDNLGFISPGSLVVRETSCGKAGCRCQADPPQRHGPYFQWSRTRDGKTEGRRLDDREAALYREWIDNRRRLDRIIARMEEVSAAAGEILLRQAVRSEPE
ncbi:MAG: hypothetical protein M0035_01035 [Actinomycetota bacterium]|nr:hypothetical protein [Actinomycetota bacterium]